MAPTVDSGPVAPTDGSMSLTDTILWAVRAVLPIILFWIWFRTQPGKATSGGKHQHPREVMLAMRDAMEEEEEPPEQLQSLRLVAEAQVQKILGIPASRGSKGGGKRGNADKGQRSPGGKGERGSFNVDRETSLGSLGGGPSPETIAAEKAAAAAAAAKKLDEEERACLESLASFVALSYKDIHPRIFLPPAGQKPPAPPRKPNDIAKSAGEADPSEAVKQNAEVQRMLKAAVLPKVGLKCSDLAKALGQKLTDSQVRPSETTFALMVETCVNVGDLRGASDFLMKMESSGYCADPELLDKVMDLYSEARTTDKDKQGASPSGGSLGLLGGLGGKEQGAGPSGGSFGLLGGLGGKEQGSALRGLGLGGDSLRGGGEAGGAPPKATTASAASAFSSAFGSGSAGLGGSSGGCGGGKSSLDDMLGSLASASPAPAARPAAAAASPSSPQRGGWGSAWSDDEDGDGF